MTYTIWEVFKLIKVEGLETDRPDSQSLKMVSKDSRMVESAPRSDPRSIKIEEKHGTVSSTKLSNSEIQRKQLQIIVDTFKNQHTSQRENPNFVFKRKRFSEEQVTEIRDLKSKESHIRLLSNLPGAFGYIFIWIRVLYGVMSYNYIIVEYLEIRNIFRLTFRWIG